MKALEAKVTANTVNTNKFNLQLSKIIELIKVAANKGEYEIWFYDAIKPDVKEELVKQGYSIGPIQTDRNESMVNISWK